MNNKIINELIIISILVFLILFLILKNNITIIIFISIILVYFIVFYFLNFSENKKLKKIIKLVNKNEKINSFISNSFIVVLITIFISIQSNQIYERQVLIEDRETSPLLNIVAEDTSYIIKKEKGMASYVTFEVYEQYTFMYNGEEYEVNLLLPYDEIGVNLHLNNKNDTLKFKTKNIDFDRDKSYEIFKNYLYSKIDKEIIVSNSRILELGFFDYKNEKLLFKYSDYQDGIRLMSTDINNLRFVKNNTTTYIFDEKILETQIEDAIDFVIDGKYS